MGLNEDPAPRNYYSSFNRPFKGSWLVMEVFY